jgi:DNA-binding SARP family transcriptional activator/Tfp pilus assembly protein PilF
MHARNRTRYDRSTLPPMAATNIRLLGPPSIERDGVSASSPRGHKAWALLAYLLLGRGVPTRQRLAELLFHDADDPLGSLRWNLAELRRTLGQPDALRGDPVELALEAATDVDVRLIASPSLLDLAAVERHAGELLEGMSFAACPALDAWLVMERQRLAAGLRAHLYERAQIELGLGRADVAARVAQRLVDLDPLDEEAQELLVRSLVAAGDRAAAIARVEACETQIARELGVAASRRIRAALPTEPAAPRATAVGGAAAARAQLETGRASVAAGAVDFGLHCLACACAEAAACNEDYLHARAQLALGSALVHARLDHGEGAAALHVAVEIAVRVGARDVAATALRELGFIDVVAGRRDRATVLLDRASEAAAGSGEELASIIGLHGVNLSDAARYQEALDCFDRSVELATGVGNRRQEAWTQAFLGRTHLLTGQLAHARTALERALELAEDEKWLAFEPMPESLLAHVDLAEGKPDDARDALEHAFAIACQVGDPCWEGMACRGLGLVERRIGRGAQALAWLEDGIARCTRVANPYQWAHGWLLDAACDVGGDHERAPAWIAALESLAARTGMRELAVRAYLHRGRRGDAGAREAGRLLAVDIVNPALEL